MELNLHVVLFHESEIWKNPVSFNLHVILSNHINIILIWKCSSTDDYILCDSTWNSSPPPPPTDACRFEVAPPTAKRWEINPFQPLPLLYLARLSHPLIVCGLPSAACKTANAQQPPGSDVSHLRSMSPRAPATGKKQLIHIVLLYLMFPFLQCRAACVQSIMPGLNAH